jgi:hypothetical protein
LIPKVCPFLFDVVGLEFLLDISESLLHSRKNCPSGRCASASNNYMNVTIFGTKTISLELLGFWTFSIVRYSRIQKYDISETGSVSVFRLGGGKDTYSVGPLRKS